MLLVPLVPVPNQTMTIFLGSQPCRINAYQKTTGLYLDLFVGSTTIVTGVLCLNTVRIVRRLYLGFVGDLAFFDTQGSSDPSYTGLGSRFVLAYLEAADLPPGVG